MATREKHLWGWLKKARLHFKHSLHIQRVENSVGVGQPDVEGFLSFKVCGNFWIELKCAGLPKRKTSFVRTKIRIDQILWHEKRARAGGKSWILLQVGSGNSAVRFLLDGRLLRRLKEGLTIMEIEKLASCKPKTPQEAIIFAVQGKPTNLNLRPRVQRDRSHSLD